MNTKRIVSGTILLVLLFCVPALAQQEKQKGASPSAYEHASDQAIFNRVSDWFATVGKNPEEKEKILAERKAERAAKRAQKEAEKAKGRSEKISEREMERQQKRLQSEEEQLRERDRDRERKREESRTKQKGK